MCSEFVYPLTRYTGCDTALSVNGTDGDGTTAPTWGIPDATDARCLAGSPGFTGCRGNLQEACGATSPSGGDPETYLFRLSVYEFLVNGLRNNAYVYKLKRLFFFSAGSVRRRRRRYKMWKTFGREDGGDFWGQGQGRWSWLLIYNPQELGQTHGKHIGCIHWFYINDKDNERNRFVPLLDMGLDMRTIQPPSSIIRLREMLPVSLLLQTLITKVQEFQDEYVNLDTLTCSWNMQVHLLYASLLQELLLGGPFGVMMETVITVIYVQIEKLRWSFPNQSLARTMCQSAGQGSGQRVVASRDYKTFKKHRDMICSATLRQQHHHVH
jgi:hypothetical protein